MLSSRIKQFNEKDLVFLYEIAFSGKLIGFEIQASKINQIDLKCKAFDCPFLVADSICEFKGWLFL